MKYYDSDSQTVRGRKVWKIRYLESIRPECALLSIKQLVKRNKLFGVDYQARACLAAMKTHFNSLIS